MLVRWKVGRLASLLLVLALLFCSPTLIACREAAEGQMGKKPLAERGVALISQEYTLYWGKQPQELTLSFFEDVPDLPLISLEDAVSILNTHVREERDALYTLALTVEGDRITLTRDNGAYAVLDFASGTLFFDDYNRFHTFSFELGALDILHSDGFDEEGRAEYFQRVTSSEKAGESTTVALRERGIPTVLLAGEGYITLQLFSDLFLSPYELMMTFNGKAAFLVDGDLMSGAIENIYYKETDAVRSRTLIDQTYRHLCLLLDFHYGLAREHGCASADAYIRQIGLYDDFYSEDTAVAFSALKTLIYRYLSDNHTALLMHSPYHASPDFSLGTTDASVGYWEFYKNYRLYTSHRSAQMASGVKPYTEVGDTAFITFNTFTSATVDYYEHSPLGGAYSDEIGLISYAHGRITREGSPIKNVVIDLATNTGGHMDGGIYLAAWVLGNAVMHISDPVRGAEGTYVYRADVNLDRVFDERDTISDKNVYLLTSPITFSCANYVAAAFKESGKVTILGTTTGGGTSCVYLASTADGAAFCFSSSLCMSGYKNGSYYKLDTGIAPDIKLTDITYFFDYGKIAQIIAALP